MENRDFLCDRLNSLLKKGADSAQCRLDENRQYEMNVENNEISLIRTTWDRRLNYAVIKDGRKGTLDLNKTDPRQAEAAAGEVLELAQAAEFDPAHDIAEKQKPQTFSCGPEQPDREKMYKKLKTFLFQTRELFPKVILEEVTFDFTRSTHYFMNSNGVDFTSQKGIYNFICIFAARDDDRSSSFNYTGFSTSELDREIMDCSTVRPLLRQSEEQLSTRPVTGKFTGDLLVTPDCLGGLVSGLINISLTDGPLIDGTSIFKDSLGKRVAADSFTLHSRPVDPEIPDGYFITSDGYAAQNAVIFKKGILKTFLLSLYGANKTGRELAPNRGGAYVIEPGPRNLNEIVGSIERGILLNRFSGGSPSKNGDFSGVAKNSYYIEDGRIQYPIRETMVSGNLRELFEDIRSISKERVNFGDSIFPWMHFTGVTISGG